MPDIKRRYAVVLANVPQSYEIQILSRGVSGKIRKTFAPGVIGCPIESTIETLPDLSLEAVVVARTGVVNVLHAAGNVRVEQEEIDRIGPRRVGSGLNAGARAEGVTEHAADVILVRG